MEVVVDRYVDQVYEDDEDNEDEEDEEDEDERCSGSCSGSICQAGKPMNNSNLDDELWTTHSTASQ